MSILTARFLAHNCAKSYGDPIASAYFADLADTLAAESAHDAAWSAYADMLPPADLQMAEFAMLTHDSAPVSISHPIAA